MSSCSGCWDSLERASEGEQFDTVLPIAPLTVRGITKLLTAKSTGQYTMAIRNEMTEHPLVVIVHDDPAADVPFCGLRFGTFCGHDASGGLTVGGGRRCPQKVKVRPGGKERVHLRSAQCAVEIQVLLPDGLMSKLDEYRIASHMEEIIINDTHLTLPSELVDRRPFKGLSDYEDVYSGDVSSSAPRFVTWSVSPTASASTSASDVLEKSLGVSSTLSDASTRASGSLEMQDASTELDAADVVEFDGAVGAEVIAYKAPLTLKAL